MFWTRRCAPAACWIALSLGVVVLPARSDDKTPAPSGKTEAAALVTQALDNEVAGDGEGRRALLERAIAADPEYPPAHWHLGRVRLGGTWLAAAAAMAKAADAELTAQYQSKRDDAAGNAALELKLAQWCVKNEMPDRARLHFWRVLTNPKVTDGQIKDAARQLDLVSVSGIVLSRAELKAQQDREKMLASAIEKYRPILAGLQPAIDGAFGKKRDEAIERLHGIDDPAVIASIETYVSEHQEGFGEELARLLAKFPQYEATQTIVRYAVMSPYLSVRELAIGELKNRPLHDYAPTLLGGLIAPIQSQFRFAVDRSGKIAYQQQFHRETPNANLVSRQDVVLHPLDLRERNFQMVRKPTGRHEFERTSGWAVNFGPELALMELAIRFEAQRLAANASNLANSESNQRAFAVLEQTTGQQLAKNPQQWWEWWQSFNQSHYPKPTYWAYGGAQSRYVRSYGYLQETYWLGPLSCFLAGTPIWTESGIRPIESIHPGDRVLSQDPETGELNFKVVVHKTLRPPSEASKLTVNGETITTTLGHPLWVTGKGWEMAKHVKEGDQLHGIGGIVNVNSIEPVPNKVEAHNLVVDDFNTYFVGNCGMLVHDNTYRQPTRAIVPGLVPDVVDKISK